MTQTAANGRALSASGRTMLAPSRLLVFRQFGFDQVLVLLHDAQRFLHRLQRCLGSIRVRAKGLQLLDAGTLVSDVHLRLLDVFAGFDQVFLLDGAIRHRIVLFRKERAPGRGGCSFSGFLQAHRRNKHPIGLTLGQFDLFEQIGEFREHLLNLCCVSQIFL